MTGERPGLASLLAPGRIGQFVSVGAAGAVVETLVVLVATTLVGAAPLLSKAVGAELSITLMFLLNDRYTFGDAGDRGLVAVVGRYLRSHLVRAAGIAVAFVVLWLLVARTDVRVVAFGADLWPTVANAAGIAVGLLVNYLLESLVTWRVHRRP